MPDNEPQYAAGIPAPPKRISPLARQVYDEIAPQLMEARVLRLVDRRALWALCEDEAILEEFYQGLWRKVRGTREALTAAAEFHGPLAEGIEPMRGDPKAAFLELVSTSQGRLMMSALNRFAERVSNERQQFGLTPSARTRINTATDLPLFQQGDLLDPLENALCG
jgi:phage terminase small subunit